MMSNVDKAIHPGMGSSMLRGKRERERDRKWGIISTASFLMLLMSGVFLMLLGVVRLSRHERVLGTTGQYPSEFDVAEMADVSSLSKPSQVRCSCCDVGIRKKWLVIAGCLQEMATLRQRRKRRKLKALPVLLGRVPGLAAGV